MAEMRMEKGGWDSATGRRGEVDDGVATEEPCECGHEMCKHGGIQLHRMHPTLGIEPSLPSLPPFLLPAPPTLLVLLHVLLFNSFPCKMRLSIVEVQCINSQ